jgi:excinuclease UvrABC nuclease subunit
MQQINDKIKLLEKKMERAANNLEFEQAALLRDRINMLKKTELI